MKIFIPFASVEALECRIAPAAIVFQAGLPGHRVGEIDYTDADSAGEESVFINTEENPSDPISALVGGGAPGVADTFYVKLTKNTLLKIFGEKGFQPLISGDGAGNVGIAGTLIAFFVDKNLDNEVQPNELTGLALGKNVQAIINGSVDGDVVSSFNDALGKIGGAGDISVHGGDLLNNAITSLAISGAVNGSIISGGQIGKLSVAGSVKAVLAGSSADGVVFDFNGALAGGGTELTASTLAPGSKGISILNLSIGSVNLIRAGDGGAGAAGGALAAITLTAGTNGLSLHSGDGGAGTASRHDGGSGGLISGVIIKGLGENETDASFNSFIQIVAGNGGASFAGSSGLGGAGGGIHDVFIGYEAGKSAPRESLVALNDAVLIQGGLGGDGRIAGAGGAISNAGVFSAPVGAGNDIRLLGGNGGATNLASSSAKAGAGGSVSSVAVFNSGESLEAQDSRIVIAGGNAGSAAAGGSGNLGGVVSGAEWIGFQIMMRAGDSSMRANSNGQYVSAMVVQESWQAVHLDSNRDVDSHDQAGGRGADMPLQSELIITPALSPFVGVGVKSFAAHLDANLETSSLKSESSFDLIEDAIALIIAGKPRP